MSLIGTGPRISTTTRVRRVSGRASQRSSARTSNADGGAPCCMVSAQVLAVRGVDANLSTPSSTLSSGT